MRKKEQNTEIQHVTSVRYACTVTILCNWIHNISFAVVRNFCQVQTAFTSLALWTVLLNDVTYCVIRRHWFIKKSVANVFPLLSMRPCPVRVFIDRLRKTFARTKSALVIGWMWHAHFHFGGKNKILWPTRWPKRLNRLSLRPFP